MRIERVIRPDPDRECPADVARPQIVKNVLVQLRHLENEVQAVEPDRKRHLDPPHDLRCDVVERDYRQLHRPTCRQCLGERHSILQKDIDYPIDGLVDDMLLTSSTKANRERALMRRTDLRREERHK
jgi:hypothetical protein